MHSRFEQVGDARAKTEKAPASVILDSHTDYGVEINEISVDELFSRYVEAGFIYPKKAARISPFLPIIKENWRKSLRAGELIHYVAVCDQPDGRWATMSGWRGTNVGWNAQHLAGTSPLAARAVLLAAQARHIRDNLDRSHQNWFRPTNKYAQRLFGSIVDDLGESCAAVTRWNYLGLPFDALARDGVPASGACAFEATEADLADVYDLATTTRGHLYAISEELDESDIALEAVDELYRRVGLRRYRHIFVFPHRTMGLAAGAIVHRGPLGMNFSFLENRCDLLISNDVTDEQLPGITHGLLAAIASKYEDFLPGYIPVATDGRTAGVLLALGAVEIASYSQSIWSRDDFGMHKWYRHVEKTYERLTQRARRKASNHDHRLYS